MCGSLTAPHPGHTPPQGKAACLGDPPGSRQVHTSPVLVPLGLTGVFCIFQWADLSTWLPTSYPLDLHSSTISLGHAGSWGAGQQHLSQEVKMLLILKTFPWPPKTCSEPQVADLKALHTGPQTSCWVWPMGTLAGDQTEGNGVNVCLPLPPPWRGSWVGCLPALGCISVAALFQLPPQTVSC